MYLDCLDVAHLIKEVKKLNLKKDESLVFYFGEKTEIDYDQIITTLNEMGITFFGGFFPAIISGGSHYETGVIIKKIPLIGPIQIIRGLDQDQIEIPSFEDIDFPKGKKTAIITLVDGLTSNISTLLYHLYNALGNRTKFIGGGAGSLSLQQKPCILTTEGLLQDAAVVAATNYSIGLGIKHGWEKLIGPLVATNTEKNVLKELNWQPAFEVYKEVIEKEISGKITPENFFGIAKGFPFGIFKEGSEDIVRDPIAVGASDELICVGDMPENTVLYILKGKSDNLISAAQEAANVSLENSPNGFKDSLIVDCISRVLFLEDDFNKEIASVESVIENKNLPKIETEGILSLGEIASFGEEGTLTFFNKTIVVGLFN